MTQATIRRIWLVPCWSSTTWSTGSSAAAPSRTTRARAAVRIASSSSASLARTSWKMPTPVLTTSTTLNSASCGGPTTMTTTNSEPRIALNRVSTLARSICAPLRPGIGGAALTLPASTRARTAAWSRPRMSVAGSAVTAA